MPQEQVEEYLEAIYDIAGKDGSAKTTAIARCLKVTPASVTEAVKSMADKGLVTYEPYHGVALTASGLAIATKIKRKHRLLEVFLNDTLHINRSKVHEEACKMEHTLSDEAGDALCRLLNAPARCPHGSLIEPCGKGVGTCVECAAAPGARDRNVIPVTELETSRTGVIAFLRGDMNVIQRLSDLGLTLGTEVKLVRKAPMDGPIELAVRRTKLAIAHDIADNIFVEIKESD
jgi:DtxR family Mn-dependent transcriptional regulator